MDARTIQSEKARIGTWLGEQLAILDQRVSAANARVEKTKQQAAEMIAQAEVHRDEVMQITAAEKERLTAHHDTQQRVFDAAARAIKA